MNYDSTLTDIFDARTSTVYTVDAVWKEMTAELTLFSDQSIYVGKLGSSEAEKYYTSLDLEPSDYFIQLQKSFSDNSEGVNKFDFDPSTGVLSWSKAVEKDFFVLHGKVEMQRLNASQIVMDVVKPLLATRRRLNLEFETLKANEASLKERLDSITRKFEESVQLKNDMEKVMLKKFTIILNEKKKYIQYLKGNADSGSNSLPSPPPSTSHKRVITSSSDDEDMDL